MPAAIAGKVTEVTNLSLGLGTLDGEMHLPGHDDSLSAAVGYPCSELENKPLYLY
jgi:hypothetical protein